MKDQEKTKDQLIDELVTLRQRIIEIENLFTQDQQRAMLELIKSEQPFRFLIEEAKGYAIFTIDPNGYVNSWNNGAKSLLGHQWAEIIGQHFSCIFTLEDLEEGKDQEELRAAGALGWSTDERWCVRSDGTRRWINSVAVRIQDETGNLIGFSITLRDMSEQKLAETALQQLNIRLETLVQERTVQLQQVLDFEAMLKRISDKVRDSLDESQVLQSTVQELVLGLGLIGCNAARYNLADSTSTIHYEYINNVPAYQSRAIQMADYPEVYNQLLDGQYFQFCSILPSQPRAHVTVLACPIMNGEGVIGDLWLIHSVAYAFNELEIRLVQQVSNQCAIAIRQARLYQTATTQVEELEKLNQLKNGFLSTVSHELRTPLTNIKMALEMLKPTLPETDKRIQRYLQVLQNECNREIDLINDLLDLQRLENASHITLPGEEINLQDWVPALVEPFQVRTRQRQQTLEINLPPDLPTLVSNRVSLKRILAELLNNACKYTPDGCVIVLSIGYKSFEAVTFSITNPTEIPAAQLPRIFDKFYRIPNTDPWEQGGTGLGLALVQKLIEQLQGNIQVESCKGWTTFTVELPNQQELN